MFDEFLKFESAICNELGEVVAWCRELTDGQVQKMLDDHKEYYINCIQV